MASCDVRHSYQRREASLLLHLLMQYFFYEENLQAYLNQMMATQLGGWNFGTVVHSNSFPIPHLSHCLYLVNRDVPCCASLSPPQVLTGRRLALSFLSQGRSLAPFYCAGTFPWVGE